KVDEKLPFKVLEFNKNSKRITLSHTRTFEETRKDAGEKEKSQEAENTQKAVKKLKANLEKTTLGDISELAALKDEMDSGNRKE
ncbi:MAG: 30S ribosomal protein S1, partial [Prevotellaceae bacterium]|nr:30S ribosomal protein S1 [Prevotellaceae bacterium]